MFVVVVVADESIDPVALDACIGDLLSAVLPRQRYTKHTESSSLLIHSYVRAACNNKQHAYFATTIIMGN